MGDQLGFTFRDIDAINCIGINIQRLSCRTATTCTCGLYVNIPFMTTNLGKRKSKNKLDKRKRKKEVADIDMSCTSLDQVGEDLLFQIASYLPNLSQLTFFCQTSKRAHHLLYQSIHSEKVRLHVCAGGIQFIAAQSTATLIITIQLTTQTINAFFLFRSLKLFQGIFLRSFGNEGNVGNFEYDQTWRERWTMIRGLRRGLVLQSDASSLPKDMNDANSVDTTSNLRRTLGVLPPREEKEAIYYDNPDYLKKGQEHSVGYFGMNILHLPPPPNAPPDWQPPVALRGDFDGIRIFDSFQEAVSVCNYWNVELERGRVTSVGDDEEGGQVLALLPHDIRSASCMDTESDAVSSPCCFLGYASGRVAAVTAMLSNERDQYHFSISDWHDAHEDELTALCLVNCSIISGKNEPVLFSACCGRNVYFYPFALDPRCGFSIERSVLAISHDCPIYSMSSCVMDLETQSFCVLVRIFCLFLCQPLHLPLFRPSNFVIKFPSVGNS